MRIPSRRALTLGTALLVAALASAAETKVLSLEEALTMAQAVNPSVLLGREAALQAAATASVQRAALWPTIALDTQQRRSRTASVGGALVRSGINNRFDLTASGSFNLLDPQRLASYKAAKIGVEAAEQTGASLVEVAMATVAEAYFNHLRNLSRIEVLDSNIARARTLLELARRQAEAGVATQIDVTRAEAQLATVQQARLQQDTAVQASELQLKQILALDPATTLTLDPFKFQRSDSPAFSTEQEQAAYAQRADLRAAETLLKQNELEVRAARYDRLPSIAFTYSGGKATENVLDGNDTTVWSGIVSMNIPIFDGNRIRAQTSLAHSRFRAQQVRVANLRRQIASEVRLAVQDAASSLAQIAVAQKNQTLSEDELRLARSRYEQGVADNREVVEAQNRLAQSSDNLVAALYQYNLSRVELARARGNVRTLLAERAP